MPDNIAMSILLSQCQTRGIPLNLQERHPAPQTRPLTFTELLPQHLPGVTVAFDQPGGMGGQIEVNGHVVHLHRGHFTPLPSYKNEYYQGSDLDHASLEISF